MSIYLVFFLINQTYKIQISMDIIMGIVALYFTENKFNLVIY